MSKEELLKKLKNLRKKWRREGTINMSSALIYYDHADDLDKVIKELERG